MAYVGATPPIAPKNSPFENFITDYDNNNPNASNSVHISFNPRNGLWLARELTENSITSNCLWYCYLSKTSLGRCTKIQQSYSHRQSKWL